MKKYKIIFADLDGTLIDTISGATFPKGIWDMKLRLEVLDKIKELNPEFLLIVTNQGGIEKGFVDENEFQCKSEYVSRAIREYCGCKVHSMYCTSNDKDNKYRKPNVGMLELLCADYVGDDFKCIKSHSLMIGDASGKPGQFSDSDKKCAENFGIDYMDVDDFVSYHENNTCFNPLPDENILWDCRNATVRRTGEIVIVKNLNAPDHDLIPEWVQVAPDGTYLRKFEPYELEF